VIGFSSCGIFVLTVEASSFSKVAREGLSQLSVSRAVAALEDRLGVKLLGCRSYRTGARAPPVRRKSSLVLAALSMVSTIS